MSDELIIIAYKIKVFISLRHIIFWKSAALATDPIKFFLDIISTAFYTIQNYKNICSKKIREWFSIYFGLDDSCILPSLILCRVWTWKISHSFWKQSWLCLWRLVVLFDYIYILLEDFNEIQIATVVSNHHVKSSWLILFVFVNKFRTYKWYAGDWRFSGERSLVQRIRLDTWVIFENVDNDCIPAFGSNIGFCILYDHRNDRIVRELKMIIAAHCFYLFQKGIVGWVLFLHDYISMLIISECWLIII